MRLRISFALALYILTELLSVQLVFSEDNSAARQMDKFAWQLFIIVNKPTKLQNGEEIPFWQSWPSATEVFDSKGTKPIWKKRTEKPEIGTALQPLFKVNISKGMASPLPAEPCTLQAGQDVHLNQATVDFIASNSLYTVEGQIKASKNGIISFPQDSIEVKAVWKIIGDDEKDLFYSQQCKGKKTVYGLVALHITSKASPNWIWATFEHTSNGPFDRYNSQQCAFIECRDRFGTAPLISTQPSQALRTLFRDANMVHEFEDFWRHYRLIGSQSDFANMNGNPFLLGNSVIEEQFGSTSSCITCHSRASIQISATANQPKRLLPSAAPAASFNGPPSPCWFSGSQGEPVFGKLDFVWSLRRAVSTTLGRPIDQPGDFVLNDCSPSFISPIANNP